MPSISQYSLVATMIMIAAACQQVSTEAMVDMGVGEIDVNLPSDAMSKPSDAGDVGGSGEVGMPEPPVRWLELEAPELWENSMPCEEGPTQISQVHDGEFMVPDLGDPDLPVGSDIDDLREKFADGDGVLPSLYSMNAHPRHEPGTGRVYDIYAMPGEPVELEMRVVNQAIPGPTGGIGYETHTLLVDYEPVEATFRHLSPDREQVISERVTSGYSFEVREPLSIIHVTLPPDTFEPGHMHELSWVMTSGRVNGGATSAMARIPLFYGGYEPARDSIPCAIPPLQANATEFERSIIPRQTGFHLVTLFTNPAPDRRIIQEVSPGETVRVYYSILPQTLDGPHTVEITPTLEGVPIGEPQWVQHSGLNSRFDATIIDARGYFDVSFPNEPGLYLVGATATEDPYVRWRDLGTQLPKKGYPEVRNLEVSSSAMPRWFKVVDE